ncbi:MAG TPA: hydantoinase/oxoprolinase family protein [Thermodesulfobacteriota bacterium]|nr:hydantoinase/oxoprolinase family protein [Thermodesulfobacteriota bacterium]
MSQTVGLGIDVGGTNTDAVLIDLGERRLLSFAKAPTTKDDLAKGISDVLKRLDRVYFPRINLISLSTTLATNSIVEGVKRRVCGILIGYGPEDYPPELREEVVLVSGGHTVQGEEKEPLDLDCVKAVLQSTENKVEAYAVCGYFSVRNPDHELQVKRLIQESTDRPVICGHEISLQLDAIKRATTALLNAHLIPVIHQLIESVKRVFQEQNIAAPLMVVKGDGSLMSESMVQDRPIETILSGPAASVIGAKYLLEQSGEIQHAVIVDIGGTTTDIALLKEGLPRLNPSGARVGNWQTNVIAIDIRTIALGGDSQITLDDEGILRVGPKRIIPLSYLGYCFPKINEELQRIYEDRSFSQWRNQTDFWIRIGHRAEEGIDLLTEKVLQELTEKPLSLFQLVRATEQMPSEILRRISYLERRSLIQKSGVTPTDLLHITGMFQAWDRDAAERGVRVLCDRTKMSLPTLIQKLEETMDRSMGIQILELILSGSVRTVRGIDQCEFCSLFLDQSFHKGAFMEGVQFKVNLQDKIIGIGAPAHAFLPSVAEKLGTQAVIPFYAGVANAVGAITSAIVIKEELFIKPFQGGFRLHSSAGIAFFGDLGEATEEGRRRLREMAYQKAKKAGADEVEVLIDEKESWATARGGDSIFIEKMITARAMGNPRMYSEGP